MERNESCEHGKYCFVCSCLIVESVEKLSIKLSEWGNFPTIKVIGHKVPRKEAVKKYKDAVRRVTRRSVEL
jgi:hypothetical protein